MTTTQVFRHSHHGIVTGTVVDVTEGWTDIRIARDLPVEGYTWPAGSTVPLLSRFLTPLSEPVHVAPTIAVACACGWVDGDATQDDIDAHLRACPMYPE